MGWGGERRREEISVLRVGLGSGGGRGEGELRKIGVYTSVSVSERAIGEIFILVDAFLGVGCEIA